MLRPGLSYREGFSRPGCHLRKAIIGYSPNHLSRFYDCRAVPEDQPFEEVISNSRNSHCR
ncbi:hypothetical protein QF048_003914 [Streptomyces sp. W4I9-2]|nr:hypothetical protein [Streptomyces sp. W4I9-2]